MIFINIKKISILIIIILFLSTAFISAAATNPEEIQALISQGKLDEALDILNSSDLNSNSDLKFYKALLLSWQEDYEEAEEILLELINSNPQRLDSYNQLARMYGWQRKFEKAKKIINKAQNIEYSSERTALLSQHAEWQKNYFEAKSLMEEAIIEAETSDLAAGYQESLARINQEINAVFYLKGRAVYSDADKEDLELTFGIEKLLVDGLNLDTAAGANYFENEANFVFRSEVKINQPLIPEKTSFSSGFVFYNGNSKDKYQLNNSFDYLINDQNLVGVNFNLVVDNKQTDYQTLELEYEHRFKQTIMVLKNTSRRYDSDWTPDFSQHIDFYYPRENYLLNLALSHYNGGEYVFKVGFQFSELFSGDKFNLSSLNLWVNNKKTSNLDFRIDLNN